MTGLRTSQSHHWLNARGVVDGDWRTEDEKSGLHARGILALPVSEVENLYYSDRSRPRPSKLSPAGCGTCSPWWNASG